MSGVYRPYIRPTPPRVLNNDTLGFTAQDFSNWSGAKTHTMMSSPDGLLLSHVVRFVVYFSTGTDIGNEVYCGNACNDDFSDLRFADGDDIALHHAFVEINNRNYAVVDVRMDVPAAGGFTFTMYYGNAGAQSTHDPEKTYRYYNPLTSKEGAAGGDITNRFFVDSTYLGPEGDPCLSVNFSSQNPSNIEGYFAYEEEVFIAEVWAREGGATNVAGGGGIIQELPGDPDGTATDRQTLRQDFNTAAFVQDMVDETTGGAGA